MSLNGPKFPAKPVVDCTDDKIITVQANKDEVDINKIVARMAKGQSFPIVNGDPFYGDVSEFNGLQDAIMKVQEAEELFMQYPAELRERFENNSVNFVEFMEDPDNTEEAIKLGLAQKRPEPVVVPPVIPPVV